MATRTTVKQLPSPTKQIAFELVKAALEGGIFTGAAPKGENQADAVSRARIDAVYLVELYAATAARLEKVQALKLSQDKQP